MKQQKKGFTIIEVVLVLAIAGLIFLMVFIALPALQSGQRNTERKDNLSRFVASATEYASNNSGKSPFENTRTTEIDAYIKKYIISTGTEQSQFTDPSGNVYKFVNKGFPASPTNTGIVPDTDTAGDGNVYYVNKAACDQDENRVRAGAGKRQFALLMMLEGGSVACADNQ